MHKILTNSDKHVLGIQISDHLTHKDYESLKPQFDERIEQHDKLNLLVELDDMQDMGVRAIADDIRFAFEYAGDIDKMAIIADGKWWENYTKTVKPLGKLAGVEVRHFDPNQRENAWNWLKRAPELT